MAVSDRRALQTRIEEGAYEKLQELADKDGRSLSNFVERLLYKSIKYTPEKAT